MVRRLGWLLLLLGPGAMAADHVWIIGGGNDPDNSQAQIEFNVNWVMQVLRARPAPPAADDRRDRLSWRHRSHDQNGGGKG